MRMVKTLFVLYIFGLLLILPSLVGVYSISTGKFSLISISWGSVDEPRRVYPGSEDVILVVQIRNDFQFRIESIVGNFSLPSGFTDPYGNSFSTSVATVTNGSVTRQYANPGEVFTLSFVISVSKSVSAGTYQGDLNLTYSYYNSSVLESKVYNVGNIDMTVSSFPLYAFKIRRVSWMVGNRVVNATPGAGGLSLHILMENLDKNPIENMYSTLDLVFPFRPDKVSLFVGSVDGDSLFELIFDNIDIDSGAASDIYDVKLILNYSFRGYGDAVKTYTTQITVSLKVEKGVEGNLVLVSFSWSGEDRVYPGANGVSLSVTLENLGSYTLNNMKLIGSLPESFRNEFGGDTVNVTNTGVYGYGDFIISSIGPIYIDETVSSGVYYMNLSIEAVASLDGSSLLVKDLVKIPMIVSEYNTNFDIVSVEWLYNNQPSPAYPDSIDVLLSIKIAYRGDETLSGLVGILTPPSGISVKSIEQTPQNVPIGSIFTLSYIVDILDSISPGDYIASLELNYTINAGGQNSLGNHILSLPLHISDPNSLSTDISVLNSFWGLNTPIYVYPNSENNPFSITLANEGPYDAREVHLKIDAPDGFYVVVNNVSVTDLLPGGSSVQSTLYINVSSLVAPGYYRFNVSIMYLLMEFGASIRKVVQFPIAIYVYEPPLKPPYIKIISFNWENNFRAYVGTDRASLLVSFVNNAPFSIDSIYIYVDAPKGLLISEGVSELYVSGPIQSWDTFTLTLPLNISNSVSPGFYNITLRVLYVLNSGGDGVVVEDIHVLPIHIYPVPIISFVSYRWVGPSPGGGTSNANLILLFRNDEYDLMDGLFAMIKLPDGFVSIESGMNVVNSTPIVSSSLNLLTDLSSGEVVSNQLLNQQSNVQVEKGDYILFQIPLRIDVSVKPDNYVFNVTLNFIDEWGVIREIEASVDIILPGSVNYLEVLEELSHLVIGERSANVSVVVRNPGDAPVYDLYVSISSFNQVVSFSSAVHHVDYLGPGENITFVWKASVSPTSSYVGGVPAVISTLYYDPVGYRHLYNQTIILFVEGLARLKVIDVTLDPAIPYVNSSVSVSATLINVGSDVAKNVEVFLEGEHLILNSDSYTFIGDIEEGSQIPFTLYAYTEDFIGDTLIYLTVKFSNIFNEEKTLRVPIKISIISKPSEEGKPATFFIFEDFWRFVVIGIVTVFLVISGILLFRMYIKSRSRLGIG